VGERVVAVTGGGLVAVNRRGGRTTITTSHGAAYGVHPDAWGGVLFMEQQGHSGAVRRAYRGRTIELGRGPLTGVQTWAGTRGRVFFTAAAAAAAQSSLPGGITAVTAELNAELSTEGAVVVSYLADQPGRVDTATAAAMTPGTAHPVRLRLSARATGRTFDRVVTPGQDAGKSSGPRVGRTAAGVQAAASPDDPVDGDRTCAIARNDSRTQVYQPHWRQVEWAADLAVRHGLTFTRPANWRQSGLPAWSPQGLIPWVDLDGGGRVPAQIMLGILAQESNLWQASPHAVEGVPGNPLVGNFYGLDYSRSGLDYFRIDWSESDCGYGVAQVTDGMRISSTSRSGTEKRAIALDYATNIAAGLNILQHKWNQVHAAGITVNDGDPRWLENWFAAVWAYNTGLRNACHRSRFAWSRQATLYDNTSRSIGERADRWDTALDYNFVACSGAETENLLPVDVQNTFGDSGKGKYRELSQMERGFLDENTDLVTFSIGGNDARFAKILQFCGRHAYCYDDVYEGDSAPLDQAEREYIRGNVIDSVAVVVREVHKAAPRAKIVLMGYPRLFDGATEACLDNTIGEDEENWVNGMVDFLTTTYQERVHQLQDEGIPVTFSDPREAFRGHGACAEAEHIHDVILDKTEGENPDSAVSQQTMHPKIEGAADYASAFTQTLRSLGM
jgi:hypothetical protein